MINLPKIQSLTAPLTAPVPSAIAIGIEAYHYITPISFPILGWIAAISAFVGIETIGGASCYALVKLHRQKNYGIEMAIALTGLLAYVASGYFTLKDSPLIIFFFLSPFAYFAYSIIRSMDVEIKEKLEETQSQIELVKAQGEVKKMELDQEKERTKQIRASTKKERASMSQHEPALKQNKCQQCHKDFGSVQALNAHTRFCKGVQE